MIAVENRCILVQDMRSVPAALEAAKQVGFEVVECTDLALDSGAGYWYGLLFSQHCLVFIG